MTHRIFRSCLLIGATVCLLDTAALAQDPLSLFQARTFTDLSGLNLPYRLYVPENYDPSQKYPLVLYLHGAGERGTDNSLPLEMEPFALAFASPEVQAAHPSFFLVPQCPLYLQETDPNFEYWVNNFEENVDGSPHAGWEPDAYRLADYSVSTSLSAVRNLLPALESEFSLDTNRLYATGWSMGGDGTWDLLMRNPGLFAAGAPIAGVGDPTQAASLAKTPLWVFQGAQDESALPSGSQKMVAAIQAEGGDIHYTEYADGSHYIAYEPGRVYEEAGFMDWLFAQSLPEATRTPAPPPASLPEPGTLGLLVLGLWGLVKLRKRI